MMNMKETFHAYSSPDFIKKIKSQQKIYIITGGPSSGKTTILTGLQLRGEYIMHEPAEKYILYLKAQGIEKPWELNDFQERLNHYFTIRERQIPQQAKRVFVDRSLIDNIAYGSDSRQVLKLADKYNYQRKVFFLESFNFCDTNHYRRENLEEALERANLTKKAYIDNGFEIIMVPPTDPESRIEFILSNI